MAVIQATQEVEVGGLQFEASLGKVTLRSYLKKQTKSKELKACIGMAQEIKCLP
jgi:hypothetical protein